MSFQRRTNIGSIAAHHVFAGTAPFAGAKAGLSAVGRVMRYDLEGSGIRLTELSRRGVLSPEDYRGGSSTVSNLGMYPVRRFTAVINPPQATILAVGQSEKRPIVRRGEIVVATMLSATLSCDHRVVDGAVGAQLLATFKSLIEDHPSDLV